MARIVGGELDCVPDLKAALECARADGLDFIAAPLYHPRFARDARRVSSARRSMGTRSDRVVACGDWSRLVVGVASAWPRGAGAARGATGRRELSSAGHLAVAAPVACAKLWFDARRANTGAPAGPPAVGACVGAPPPDRGLETPFVVQLHNFAPLAAHAQCFAFDHPGDAGATNDRDVDLAWDIAVDATVHGLAGTFHADLYGDVSISIYPPTFSEGMFSWFPLFLPFSAPVRVEAGGTLAVSIWRRSDPGRAWYEWAPTAPVVLPIHNPNGRSCAMLL
ncbi:hypothetical protein JL720_13112 [Aureococcus anophagefferens]|nr:hypothetical protein JL720_13112 [Aureococcus anophagefferens]